MLFHANVPLHLWVEAFSTTVFTINCLPTLVLNEASPFKILYGTSPFKILYGKSPIYAIFWIFGFLCFLYLRDYAKHKFELRSLPCIFLGYNSFYKGFRCLNPKSHRVFVTWHAWFDETVFPSSSSHMQPSHALSDYISFHDPSSSNYSLFNTNSTTSSRPLPSVTPSKPCKSSVLKLNTSGSSSISLPHVPTPINEQVSKLPLVHTLRNEPLSDMPIAPT